ncbi:hypothetical protein ACFFMN_01550 [Planobispora siamensis]|uniref:Uncharacterized protein n=1 Tax=Planobispora siamensis TaxID=936338 RepID=A0A8J3WND4_9ACTN|nr:hypothetical protein [Planobispora siamensis]GIH95705.1 hypothetical protein Psi01_63350 [Planobispora siamensis]
MIGKEPRRFAPGRAWRRRSALVPVVTSVVALIVTSVVALVVASVFAVAVHLTGRDGAEEVSRPAATPAEESDPPDALITDREQVIDLATLGPDSPPEHREFLEDLRRNGLLEEGPPSGE